MPQIQVEEANAVLLDQSHPSLYSDCFHGISQGEIIFLLKINLQAVLGFTLPPGSGEKLSLGEI